MNDLNLRAVALVSGLLTFGLSVHAKEPTFPIVLENGVLRISFDAGAQTNTGAHFDVFDKRTKRTWRQIDAGIKASGFQLSKESASFGLSLPGHTNGYRAAIRLEPNLPEFTVEISGPTDTEVRAPIFYPSAFASAPGDRIVVPIGEGISYPAETADAPLGSRPYYSGHGITMAFFAAMEDKVLPSGEATGGAAYLAICETPDNSGIDLLRADAGRGLLTVRPLWGRRPRALRLRPAHPLRLLRRQRACGDLQALPPLCAGAGPGRSVRGENPAESSAS